jgi:serine/threonine-protein kinase RsbT
VRNEGWQKAPASGRAASPGKNGRVAIRDVSIPVQSDLDIVGASHQGRSLAAALGFSPGDATLIATAISELARNIILYAKRGQIILKPVAQSDSSGLVIVASDEGPGIPDVRRALEDGYSTSQSLGLGLPGVRRLMDEFEIVSEVNRGTKVTVKKWRR